MKSTLTINSYPPAPKFAYPLLARNPAGDVVLFTDHTTGICVYAHTGSSNHLGDGGVNKWQSVETAVSPWKLLPVTEVVTLSND